MAGGEESSRAENRRTFVRACPPLGRRVRPVDEGEPKLAQRLSRFVQVGSAVPHRLCLGPHAVCAHGLLDFGLALAREPPRLAQAVLLCGRERLLDADEVAHELDVGPVACAEEAGEDELQLREERCVRPSAIHCAVQQRRGGAHLDMAADAEREQQLLHVALDGRAAGHHGRREVLKERDVRHVRLVGLLEPLASRDERQGRDELDEVALLDDGHLLPPLGKDGEDLHIGLSVRTAHQDAKIRRTFSANAGAVVTSVSLFAPLPRMLGLARKRIHSRRLSS